MLTCDSKRVAQIIRTVEKKVIQPKRWIDANMRSHKNVHLKVDAHLTPTLPIVLPSEWVLIDMLSFIFNATNYCSVFQTNNFKKIDSHE